MSKKGRNSNNNKKSEIQSNDNHTRTTQRLPEENRLGENIRRILKNFLIRKLILKNKYCVSHGLHSKIFKVRPYKYKGKRYIFEF